MHAYACITSPLAYSHFSPCSATLPQRGCLLERSCLLRKEVACRFGYMMITLFCSYIAAHRHTSKCINSEAMASVRQEAAARRAHERSIRGPPCNHCMTNPGVPMRLVHDRLTESERDFMHARHHTIRRICIRCLQKIMYQRRMRWWTFVFQSHLILGDPILVPRISGYLCSAVRFQHCRCGYCDPNWLLRGWRCWG